MEARPSIRTRRTVPVPGFLVLGLVAVYLAGWLPLGLYSDEVALRLDKARSMVDGYRQYGLFPQCLSHIGPIPLLLRPGAWSMAAFDQWAGWHGLRTIPFLLLLAWTGSLLTLKREGLRPLLICGAFIGLSGVGLMLLRSESIAMLHLLVCLLTLAVAARRPATAIVPAVLVLHLWVLSLSLMVHAQGVMLVPLSLLGLWRLLHRTPVLSALVTLLVAAMVWQGVAVSRFHCSEEPALESAIQQNLGSTASLSDPANRVARLAKRGARYGHHAFYKSASNPPITPPVTAWAAHALNVPIAMVVLGNLILLACALARGVRHGWHAYAHRLRPRDWRATWQAMLWDPWMPVTGCALILVLYGLYDVSGAFYRALFINLFTVTLIVAMPPLASLRSRRWVDGFAMLAAATCLLSTLANAIYETPPLRAGYTGTGTALRTDWNAVARDAQALALQCHIAPDAPRVVVDDGTYRALADHPQPIHLTYVYYDEILQHGTYDAMSAHQRMAKLRAVMPSGVIARCRAMDSFQLPHTARRGDLCCLGFSNP